MRQTARGRSYRDSQLMTCSYVRGIAPGEYSLARSVVDVVVANQPFVDGLIAELLLHGAAEGLATAALRKVRAAARTVNCIVAEGVSRDGFMVC